MPLSKRADGMWAFGPLPNVAPRAEMFNRMVMGINFLNEVRVIAPFVWTITARNKNKTWVTPTPENPYTVIEFSQNGTVKENTDYISDYYVPINSSLSVGADRSVAKSDIKSFDLASVGLPGGVYNVSSQSESSITFTPFVHPLLNNAIPSYLQKNLKRRFLGIVTEQTASCSSVPAPKSPGTNNTVIYCSSPLWNSDGVYEVGIPSVSLPTTKNKVDRYFKFFDSGGSISATANGTAKYFGIQYGTNNNGTKHFCSYSCGDGYSKSIDFTYTNMFPATCKLN
jgi:hypothetical protein